MQTALFKAATSAGSSRSQRFGTYPAQSSWAPVLVALVVEDLALADQPRVAELLALGDRASAPSLACQATLASSR